MIKTEIQEIQKDPLDESAQERLVMPKIVSTNTKKETNSTGSGSQQNASNRRLSSRDLAHMELVEKCRTWIQGLPDRFSGLNTVISVPTDT